MITYRTDKKVNYKKLIELFNEVGWNDKTSDLDRLKDMVDNLRIMDNQRVAI